MNSNETSYNHRARQLFDRQVKDWPLAAANYAALANIETKTLSINGFDFIVQFNPARITSSAAKVDAQTIHKRKCFLCRHHLPAEQEVLPYLTQSGNEYMILCNPFPIFPSHFTIPDCNHTPQVISERVEDMLELAQQLQDYVLFYNGPKCGASAPDHFHFQAGIKGFLPIQALVESSETLMRYPIPAFVFESEEASAVASYFHLFFDLFQELVPQDPEPMLNLICWKTEKKYYLVLFPRKLHRPSQFFAEGDAHILLSPASIDLGGVLITPLKKDFCKLSAETISDIITQISILPETFTKLANQLEQ